MRLNRDPRRQLVSIRRLGGEDWIRGVLDEAGFAGLETGETTVSAWVQCPAEWTSNASRWAEVLGVLDDAGALCKTDGVEVGGKVVARWHVTHVVRRGANE